jgi:hypothetical protein
MMSKLKRWNNLGLAVGLCALAISAGLSTARAEDSLEASAAATDSRASTAGVETTAPESRTSETAASETTASEPGAGTGAAAPLKQVEVRPADKAAAPPDPSRPYFVEFRARAAYNYGHTFVVHGKFGDPITAKSVVGLHPAGDSVPWSIGHLIPVPSETGWSDGDVGYNDKYIVAKYRVYLTEMEYRTVLARMRQMQRNTPMWHAVVYNCNAFTGDIASFMGLSHPFHWLMPKDYVNGIKQMAGGRQKLPTTWLASVNPAAAHEQAHELARHEPASNAHQENASTHDQARQPTASTPAANSRRQHAAVAQPAVRPQTAGPTPPSYATAQ